MPLILVVDDEESILELITFNLEKEGFRVSTAVDGQEALQKVAANKPDLIVLDWMLPGIDGLEVCRRIRKDPATSDIPVIMLTARGEEVDIILGLELGANDYVTKPFSPRQLAARVKAQLRAQTTNSRPEKESSGVVRQGTLVLDADRYLVEKDGVVIEMPPKEFELLLLLASNPGRVYRREEILDKVWGYDYPADTRTVDVHIRHLRQKLEDDANLPQLLQTVRGVGYRFRELRR
ncbi:MAG: response regulator transcription factor [Bacillota bacterium]|nr:response regulator transcription factor [Bacillota bacterium]MDW7683914.1 response regulator transcription factor [Bacillota bacterium]